MLPLSACPATMSSDMKTNVLPYKKSINCAGFSDEQIAMIWDFYVTKAIAGSASQQRKVSDYGLSKIPYDEMLKIAEVPDGCCNALLADKMPETLRLNDLLIVGEKGVPVEIDIDIPRIAYLIPYQIIDNGKPQAKNNCGKAEALLTHIRNSFAHGNTYFFDNGNVLLEDKNGSTITAMCLLRQQTLLDWIQLIDKSQKYYVLHDV